MKTIRSNLLSLAVLFLAVAFLPLFLGVKDLSEWTKLWNTIKKTVRVAPEEDNFGMVKAYSEAAADAHPRMLEANTQNSLGDRERREARTHFLDSFLTAARAVEPFDSNPEGMISNKALFDNTFLATEAPRWVGSRLRNFYRSTIFKIFDINKNISTDLCAVAPSKNDLKITGITLRSDVGFAGHMNGAVDAGETISVSITLTNTGKRDWRSPSAFLISDDPYVEVDQGEATYTERDEASGEARIFNPGISITARETYTFSVSPDCPDGRTVKFKLRVWDTNFGGENDEFLERFTVKVFKIGPLAFGDVKVDDDMIGLSDGDGKGTIETGETIEYVVKLDNEGVVPLNEVQASITANQNFIVFKSGYDRLRYKSIGAKSGKPQNASFVFTVDDGAASSTPEFALLLKATGTARGYKYSWIATYGETIRRPAIPALDTDPSGTGTIRDVPALGEVSAAAALMAVGKIVVAAPDGTVTTARSGSWEAKVQGAGMMNDVPAGPVSMTTTGMDFSDAFDSVIVPADGSAEWKPYKTGKFTVRTDPYGADVYTNGMYRGAGPVTLEESNPATLILEARREGYENAKGYGSVFLGKEQTLTLTLPLKKQAGADSLHGEILVLGGSFRMGSNSGDPDERPVRSVRVSDFWMMRTEVTQRDYAALIGINPSSSRGDTLPVEQVSWYDAVNYANALSRKDGLNPAYSVSGTSVNWDRNANGWRLPTEAEWEFAARGGSASWGCMYSGSTDPNAVAWYGSNSGSIAHAVGTKAANELGLHDLSGNVWEWCWDWYGTYGSGIQIDPADAPPGEYRVKRGGSWNNVALRSRSANRDSSAPDDRCGYLGFRLCRSAIRRPVSGT